MRKLFQRELGGAKRGRFFQHFFPDSSGEEAFSKGATKHKKMSIFAHFFPDSSGEEAIPKGVWMLFFTQLFHIF